MTSTKIATLISAGLLTAGCVALFATNLPGTDLELIDRLDNLVQIRFQNPEPNRLGMSRIVRPLSFGVHYRPDTSLPTDFYPETSAEADVIAALEYRKIQLGIYLFGAAITKSEPESPNYRALKGPAAITHTTPRPLWYPSASGQPVVIYPSPDTQALANWKEIYPLALKSMRSFQDGGHGFETKFDTWYIAARPVAASAEICLTCHNSPVYGTSDNIKLNDRLGGILYAYRHSERQ